MEVTGEQSTEPELGQLKVTSEMQTASDDGSGSS